MDITELVQILNNVGDEEIRYIASSTDVGQCRCRIFIAMRESMAEIASKADYDLTS